MSVARKPRRIGPPEPPPAPAAGEPAEIGFDLGAFLDDLTAREAMDLDRATGGYFTRRTAGADEPISLNELIPIAWIARRREEPGLTFRQVEAMHMADIAEVFAALGRLDRPKARSAPA